MDIFALTHLDYHGRRKFQGCETILSSQPSLHGSERLVRRYSSFKVVLNLSRNANSRQE
jgi:hypothetical protein